MPETKPRRKRRNFAQELKDLEQYCRIKADVLESINTVDSLRDSRNAEIAAYYDILNHIGGDNGRRKD